MRTYMYKYYLLSLCMIPSSVTLGKASLQRVYEFFGAKTHEAVVDKEFNLEQPGTLTINNTHGNITIERTWKDKKVCVRALKKSAKAEHLDIIDIKDDLQTNNKITNLKLETECEDEKAKIQVDYELIIPITMKLQLSTDRGSIQVNEVHGPVMATTIHGNIEINNTTNTVVAQTEETGSITINQARGNIRATTNKGDITITDAINSVIAKTEKGKITTACSTVPQTGRIILSSAAGAITLGLPAEVNATFLGKTERGTLTSNIPITIKPITTTLDSKTWSRFKKEVDGTLGTGKADIRVSSASGNIKIVQTTTA